MTTIVNVVGARPQFIKAGPVSKALERAGVDELLVHTGQHYDAPMSDQIMSDVGLRQPDANLGVGSASHAVQTAKILEGVERYLFDNEAEAVLTYGDTNSTIATALAATKLGVFTAHVEAGLRSFNRVMPEEVNRVATDHISDLLFAPTHTAMEHLRNEGLGDKSILTGDVMADALQSIDTRNVELPRWLEKPFYLATIHRAETTDDADRLRAVIDSLRAVDHPVNLLAHPRLQNRIGELGIVDGGSLHIRKPLGYAEMLAGLRASSGLFTDSGGLQKEAFILGVPCVTIRTETEWPETLEGNWNVLAEPGSNLNPLLERKISSTEHHPFGDGHAAERLVSSLLDRI
jgi:UDP-N-acetylglucosamine 2-epimerase (non-hydrolysing)